MIIGICGLIGSGKDTIADYLVNIHEFRRDSFAATLKDAVASVFGWDRMMLEGRTKSSREWREQRDEWWSQRLGRDITPRWILQYWGTEVCRQGFHDDIWIASLENKLRNTRDDVVISDCRFPNEISAIRNQGGYVIRVVRGPDPEWFHYAQHHPEQMPVEFPQVHASEYSWANTRFDRVIENNGSLDELYSEITDLVQYLHDAKVGLVA
jgi:hypothetical protein